jgi:hypothetical protein
LQLVLGGWPGSPKQIARSLARCGRFAALQVLFNVASLIAGCGHSLFEFFRRHAEHLRPVAKIAILAYIDSPAILATAFFEVIHECLRRIEAVAPVSKAYAQATPSAGAISTATAMLPGGSRTSWEIACGPKPTTVETRVCISGPDASAEMVRFFLALPRAGSA